jgi:myo-inositol 2-dehydrogenase/D-chiro-inositol 1-dehydrogenase
MSHENDPAQPVRGNQAKATIPSQVNRRNFIAGSAQLAVAGGLVGAGLPGLSLARAANVSGSDTVKLGLIGAGGRGAGAVVQAMNTNSCNVELTAIGDAFMSRVEGSLQSIQREHGEKVQVPESNRFAGFDAYQGVLESDVDMVILATPPGFRPLHFEAAVNAGKHVFMEKPVAVDAPGCRRVLAAGELATQRGLLVQVGLQRRHEDAYREIISKLQEGIIGDLIYSRVYWNNPGVWVNPRRPEQTEMEYQMRNWYYFNWLCGDHIVEQHIHNIDVINWLMNDYPVSAQGQGGRLVRKGKDYGQIFDHHMVEYTYANGHKMISQCRHMPECWNEVAEYVHGSNGWADISRGRIFNKEGEPIFRSRGGRNGHQQEHVNLFQDYIEGKRPNEAEYGAKSTFASILGRLATYTGIVLNWDDAINSKVSLGDLDSLKSMDDVPPVVPDENGDYPVAVPGTGIRDVIDF